VPGTELIHVDIDAAEIGRSFPVALGAVADVALAARQLVEAAEARPQRDSSDLAERVRVARNEVWARMASRGSSLEFPLKPERILEDVRAVVPADSVLVTDVGWNKNGVAQGYRLPAQGLFLTPGGLATMGFGPAAAIGVKYAARDRTVVALIGDGAMASQLPALPTAVEQGLAVVWVVMNNSAFGTIADLEQSHFGVQYGTVFRDPAGAPYTPDFARLARACGAWGERVESADQLRPLLREALAVAVPALVDVPMVNDPVPTPGHWNINDIYRGRF
jgi:acetolactate synthase-1/2/3 large subunit